MGGKNYLNSKEYLAKFLEKFRPTSLVIYEDVGSVISRLYMFLNTFEEGELKLGIDRRQYFRLRPKPNIGRGQTSAFGHLQAEG